MFAQHSKAVFDIGEKRCHLVIPSFGSLLSVQGNLNLLDSKSFELSALCLIHASEQAFLRKKATATKAII